MFGLVFEFDGVSSIWNLSPITYIRRGVVVFPVLLEVETMIGLCFLSLLYNPYFIHHLF